MSLPVRDSIAKTFSVPGVPTNNPATIATAPDDRPLRVLVDNVGPTTVRIAFSSSSLGGTTSDGVDHFQLAPDKERYLYIAPKQKIYAVSVGAIGRVSVVISDALSYQPEPTATGC